MLRSRRLRSVGMGRHKGVPYGRATVNRRPRPGPVGELHGADFLSLRDVGHEPRVVATLAVAHAALPTASVGMGRHKGVPYGRATVNRRPRPGPVGELHGANFLVATRCRPRTPRRGDPRGRPCCAPDGFGRHGTPQGRPLRASNGQPSTAPRPGRRIAWRRLLVATRCRPRTPRRGDPCGRPCCAPDGFGRHGTPQGRPLRASNCQPSTAPRPGRRIAWRKLSCRYAMSATNPA